MGVIKIAVRAIINQEIKQNIHQSFYFFNSLSLFYVLFPLPYPLPQKMHVFLKFGLLFELQHHYVLLPSRWNIN